MIVAGILAIIVPPASGIAVTILLGWLLVFCGAAHLAYAWETRHSGGLWWGLLLGVIYIAAGGYISLHPMAGLASLTLVLAAYLLVESILEFILAYQLRPLTRVGLAGAGWDYHPYPRHHDRVDMALQHPVGDRHAGGHQHAFQRDYPIDDFPERTPRGTRLSGRTPCTGARRWRNCGN